MNCPTECPEDEEKVFNLKRLVRCDECPHKKANDKFKADVEGELIYRFGDDHRFKFEELLDAFYGTTKKLEAAASEIPVKVNQMLRVYSHEKFRFEKSEDENKPQS